MRLSSALGLTLTNDLVPAFLYFLSPHLLRLRLDRVGLATQSQPPIINQPISRAASLQRLLTSLRLQIVCISVLYPIRSNAALMRFNARHNPRFNKRRPYQPLLGGYHRTGVYASVVTLTLSDVGRIYFPSPAPNT